jgi:hypothetical protein
VSNTIKIFIYFWCSGTITKCIYRKLLSLSPDARQRYLAPIFLGSVVAERTLMHVVALMNTANIYSLTRKFTISLDPTPTLQDGSRWVVCPLAVLVTSQRCWLWNYDTSGFYSKIPQMPEVTSMLNHVFYVRNRMIVKEYGKYSTLTLYSFSRVRPASKVPRIVGKRKRERCRVSWM